MIKISDRTLHVEGTRADLITEFMCIVHSMLEKEIISREHMMFLVGRECIPEDEMKQMIIDYIDNMDDIGNALKLLNRLER